MLYYRIEYTPKAIKKDLPSLAVPIRRRVVQAIEEKLTSHPEIYGKPLQYGHSGRWSLRVGSYRVVYEIHNNEVKVLIITISHRKDAYH